MNTDATMSASTTRAWTATNFAARCKDGTIPYDFTLTDFAGNLWNVHKVILSFHSEVLGRMAFSKFKEGLEKNIKLKDEETDVLEAFVAYMYDFDYLVPHVVQSLGACSLGTHMYILADKYDIPALKYLAHDNLKKWIAEFIRQPVPGDWGDFTLAIRAAYSVEKVTNDIRTTLRTPILANHLLEDEDNRQDLAVAMHWHPQFAIDLVVEQNHKLKVIEDGQREQVQRRGGWMEVDEEPAGQMEREAMGRAMEYNDAASEGFDFGDGRYPL